MVSDRKAIAFYLPETRILLDELPDDFFDLSQSEVKMLYSEFVQKRKELEDKPMMTTSLRELHHARRVQEFLDKYKYCIVRIQFADRSVLQGIFQPNEPFTEVSNFVKSYLREDLLEFFLFTTPPKTIPDPDKTLLELNFVPGVKLYFGTPHTHMSTFLKENILVNIKTPEVAAKEAQKYRMTKVVNENDTKEMKDKNIGVKELCSCNNVDYSHSKEQDQPIPGTSLDKSRSSNNQNKVPKWFKPSKK